MNFKLRHVVNLLVRLFTGDKYYVCEECHKIHKRDGKEIRLDANKEYLLYNRWWYGSVAGNCYLEKKRTVSRILNEGLFEI